jgi:hypothetical protein
MGVNALYASLFEPDIARIDLHEPPTSHQKGPTYLNVLKYLDTPQAAPWPRPQARCGFIPLTRQHGDSPTKRQRNWDAETRSN